MITPIPRTGLNVVDLSKGTPVSTLAKRTNTMTLVVTWIVGLTAAAMSGVNLTDLAIESGYPRETAWGLFVCADGLALAASLAICRSAAEGERARLPWILLLSTILVSVAGNALTADDTISRAVHALPPLSACAAIELLARSLRKSLTEEAAEADRLAQEAAAEAARLAREEAAQQRAERRATQPAKPRQTASCGASRPRGKSNDPEVIEKVLAMRAEVPNPVTYRQIAKQLGIDKNAVMKIAKEAEAA